MKHFIKHKEPYGVCDRTGDVVPRSDLVKEKEYRGNTLVWNGLYVRSSAVDIPQPQSKVPPIKADPYPIKEPRPLQNSTSYYDDHKDDVVDAFRVYDELREVRWQMYKNIISVKDIQSVQEKIELDSEEVGELGAQEVAFGEKLKTPVACDRVDTSSDWKEVTKKMNQVIWTQG